VSAAHFLVVSITGRITLVVRDLGVFRGQHVTAQAVAALGHGHDCEVEVHTYWLTRAGALVDVRSLVLERCRARVAAGGFHGPEACGRGW